MSRIRLLIVSTIDPEDGGEPDEIVQKMEGFLEERENLRVLKYKEKSGTPDEVKTTVKAGVEDVTVIRQGLISYRQRYRPGETTTSVVDTPGGTSEMEVSTLSYQREEAGGDGEIRFSFRLTMAGEAMGRYQLLIQWTEVPTQG